MLKYRTRWAGTTIAEVCAYKVIKETDKSIVYTGPSGRASRELKASSDTRWFDTFEEAKNYLLQESSAQIKHKQDTIERLTQYHATLLNL